MALNPGLSKEDVQRHGALAEWSGVISIGLYVLFGLLIAAVIAVLVHSSVQRSREERRRASWDALYTALKDKEGPRESIPAIEGVWDRLGGATAQAAAAMELGQLHYQMATDAARPLPDRKDSLRKAQACYDLVRKHPEWSALPAFGALSHQQAALCREQDGDYDAAVAILKEATGKFGRHYLYQMLCYDLARSLWLRALAAEAKGQDGGADRKEAAEQLDRAVGDTPADQASYMTWEREARWLKSQLAAKGPALAIFPNNAPPPHKSEEKKAGDAKAGDTKAPEKTDAAPKVEAAPKPDAKAAPAKAEAKK